jgi:aspartate carbamoyltransferase catalytic subunit
MPMWTTIRTRMQSLQRLHVAIAGDASGDAVIQELLLEAISGLKELTAVEVEFWKPVKLLPKRIGEPSLKKVEIKERLKRYLENVN